MRTLRIAFCVACVGLVALHAEDDSKEQQAQPEEIPNFNQLDEYIYVPKSTLSLGNRFFFTGPKVKYSGQGGLPSPVDPGQNDQNVPNISRTYIDGTVLPDQRSIPVSTGVGNTITVPIASDGRTNSWSYVNNSQIVQPGTPGYQPQYDGDIQFHTYNATITDTSTHDSTAASSLGLELVLDRDMGKIGKNIKWSLTAGFSIADIHSSVYASVPTNEVILTDTYDTFGQVIPSAPFTSPNTANQTVINSSGSAVTGSNSTAQQQQVDTTILIGNAPINRTYTNTTIETTNRYWVEGAYYTLRVGPTIVVPFGSHFRFNVSAGPALIYAGSTMNVLEDLTVATGTNFTELYSKENTKLLPGYYVDVNLQYQLTDTAGFYLGGVYEGAGSYGQKDPSGAGTEYVDRVSFGSEEGVKSGLTLRF